MNLSRTDLECRPSDRPEPARSTRLALAVALASRSLHLVVADRCSGLTALPLGTRLACDHQACRTPQRPSLPASAFILADSGPRPSCPSSSICLRSNCTSRPDEVAGHRLGQLRVGAHERRPEPVRRPSFPSARPEDLDSALAQKSAVRAAYAAHCRSDRRTGNSTMAMIMSPCAMSA